MRHLANAFAAIVLFCGTPAASQTVLDATCSARDHSVSPVAGQHQGGSHGSGAGAAAKVTPILRSGRTISGQPLKLPQGEAEVAAASVEIPAGGALPIHQHPWSRFVYVERGSLRVVNLDTGSSNDFQAGQVLPEVVGQWHEARALGASPVRLIVIDVVPPGVNNTIMRPVNPAR